LFNSIVEQYIIAKLGTFLWATRYVSNWTRGIYSAVKNLQQTTQTLLCHCHNTFYCSFIFSLLWPDIQWQHTQQFIFTHVQTSPWLSYPLINRKHLWHQLPKFHHSCCHAELRKSDLEVTARHLHKVEAVQHVHLTNIPVWFGLLGDV